MNNENTEYIRLLAAYAGKSEEEIVDTIIGERRKNDEGGLQKVVQLLAAMWPEKAAPAEPVKIRRKPGPKPKQPNLNKPEKMSKEEFISYMSNRDVNRIQNSAEQALAEEKEW